jgi:hypothetical protein
MMRPSGGGGHLTAEVAFSVSRDFLGVLLDGQLG